LQADG